MNKSNVRLSGESANGAKPPIDPWILWVTFRRCWPWALPVGAILAGLAVYSVLSSFKPTYEASHILETNRNVIFDLNPQMKNLAREEKTLFFNPVVIDPVLGRSDLRAVSNLSNQETAESNLKRNLTISSAGSGGRMMVSYRDTSKEGAMLVCNAIVEAYLAFRDQIDRNHVNEMVSLLEGPIQIWEKKVEGKTENVEKLMKMVHGAVPSDTVSVVENNRNRSQMVELGMQIATLNADIEVGKLRLREREKTNEQRLSTSVAEVTPLPVEPLVLTEAAIERAMLADPDVVRAMEMVKHYDAKVRFGDQRVRLNDRRESEDKVNEWSRKLEEAKVPARAVAIAKLNQQIEQDFEARKAKAEQDAEIQRNAIQDQRRQAVDVEYIELKNRQNELMIRLEVAQKSYDEERRRLEEFGGMTAKLASAQNQLQIDQETLQNLRKKTVAYQTARSQDSSVYSVAPATLPRTPVEKIPYKKIFMFGGLAMLIPFLLGVLWEIRTQRLTDSNMCDKNGLSVIGEIARLPSGSNAVKSRRVFEESIDTLRASLFLSIDTRNTRSIAVVSSMSGEGKSSVSSQLALSISKATGETVLLVDADMRCPDQHEIFGLEMGLGLSGVLSGKTTIDKAVDRSLGDLIHVLPAGPLTNSPHRLISPKKIQAFVREALKEYSYVVLDTAPILSAGESLAVSAAVDSTLLCVMRDVSRVDNVVRTTRRLEAAGATLAGTVFSGVSARNYAYRYGDYHYSSPEAHVHSVSNAS